MLTTRDIKRLNAARKVLRRLEDECAHSRSAESNGWRNPDGHSYGRLAEAADHAEGAIFNVLNTANAHRIAEVPDDLMHMREEVEV